MQSDQLLELTYNKKKAEEIPFDLKWGFKSPDVASASASLLKSLPSANGVHFDAYYCRRRDRLDSVSERLDLSLIGLMRESVRPEIVDPPENIWSPPIRYECKLDAHLDGAAHQTIFSMNFRDEEKCVLDQVTSGSRHVCLFITQTETRKSISCTTRALVLILGSNRQFDE